MHELRVSRVRERDRVALCGRSSPLGLQTFRVSIKTKERTKQLMKQIYLENQDNILITTN
jgi:hypothetical protein